MYMSVMRSVSALQLRDPPVFGSALLIDDMVVANVSSAAWRSRR